MDPKKSNKIREIVRLQQILKKWRKLANSSKTTSSNSNSSSSKSIKFLKRTLSISEREGGGSSNVVPKGYLAVCVGEELKRFIIPTEYLGHQVFHMLLREAEEEFGFEQTGVLRIPCEVPVFESILKMVEGKKGKFYSQECRLGIEEIVGCCSSGNQLSYSHHPQSPIMPTNETEVPHEPFLFRLYHHMQGGSHILQQNNSASQKGEITVLVFIKSVKLQLHAEMLLMMANNAVATVDLKHSASEAY
ncbi:auxin-responsive protein SAUR50-like [Senna tora]|uniref:Auxin-responsive protein SAUR50-like n=1 Tax=Senna tora TaxID=362788 RepID=A0A834T8D5_9FABA|nr:auxin-responsive protein SAUR50-like [Senna tora]